MLYTRLSRSLNSSFCAYLNPCTPQYQIWWIILAGFPISDNTQDIGNIRGEQAGAELCQTQAYVDSATVLRAFSAPVLLLYNISFNMYYL